MAVASHLVHARRRGFPMIARTPRPRGSRFFGLTLAALAAVALAPSAGPVLADSRYSLRGNGESVQSSSAEIRAQGGAEAVGSEPSLSGNPASLVLSDRTIFFGTYETQWIRTEEPRGAGGLRVRKDYEGLAPNLGLVFPLRGGLRVGAGLLVERRKGGRIESATSTPDGQDYEQVFEVGGNLLRIPVLAGRSFGRVQVGAGLDVLLLNQKLTWENDFPDEAEVEGWRDSQDLDRTSLWGVAWRAGVRVPVGDRLAIGGWYSLPSDLDGSRRIENDDTDDRDDLKIDRGGEVASRWGLGFEVSPFSRLRLRADVVREGWADLTPLNPLDEFVDVTRIAIGGEWNPTERVRGLQWPIRAGYRTESLHALDGGGREIREHVFTAGSGIGFADGRGTIDWYAEYGWRGVQDESEYYEQFTRIGLTLTGVEKWGRRRSPADEDDGDW